MSLMKTSLSYLDLKLFTFGTVLVNQFIFVFQSSCIACILSKYVGFDQLWIAILQKFVAANSKLNPLSPGIKG
jgi:hypothetical protein